MMNSRIIFAGVVALSVLFTAQAQNTEAAPQWTTEVAVSCSPLNASSQMSQLMLISAGHFSK
jgi:hypothetical protein